jgi:D-amino acid aminotransferase
MTHTHYCYFNGKIIAFNNAGLQLDDLGIIRGFGVFDFLRTYHGNPFLLKEHLARLHHSAERLKLKIPIADTRIQEIIEELIKKNQLPEANIRLVITGGPSDDGISVITPTFYILTTTAHPIEPRLYKTGITLMTHEYLRLVPEIKSLNYMTAVLLQEEKKKRGAYEILYIWKNKILEAATSNFFIVKDNTLITPKQNILIGITRNFVLKLAHKALAIEERDISLAELAQAQECFITASNKEILPVVKIDTHSIGNGKVGPCTQNLLQKYRRAVAN